MSFRTQYILFTAVLSVALGLKTEAQIPHTLQCFPSHLQFFARDTSNTGTLCVAGAIDSVGFDSVVCSIYKNGSAYKRYANKLSYNGGHAQFTFAPTIRAELSEYEIKLFVAANNNYILFRKEDSLVCGDVYMINGQSNSHPSNVLSTYKNEFCRSFGVQTDYLNTVNYDAKDTLWGLANGHGMGNVYSGPLLVGVWGIKLMQLIKEKYKVPVCMINGGSGGSSIEYNLPPADRQDLTSAYGRLLYRFTKARLADKVKAIFWYQGESNTFASSNPSYEANFDSLYKTWAIDFPSTKKVYVFQIHQGCGGLYQQEIREMQRKFANTYSNISLMSTVGVKGHDGCHYDLDGYEETAANIYRLVAKDFYKSVDTLDINPPNIIKAHYMPGHKIIRLYFDTKSNLVWPKDTLGQRMLDYIYLDTSIAQISSYVMQGKILQLTLAAKSSATKITYLPNVFYNNSTVFYQGPYIRNKRGIGVLSFHEFPIDSSPPPIAEFSVSNTQVCAGDTLVFSDKSIYNPNYRRWNFPGATSITIKDTQAFVVYSNSGLYDVSLFVSNTFGGDSIWKGNYIKVLARPQVNAGMDDSICFGDSIYLQASGGLKYHWFPNAGLNIDTIFNPIAKPGQTTFYRLTATDSNKCSNTDTVMIYVKSLPSVNAGADVVLCTNSGVLNLSGSPAGGVWNGMGLMNNQFVPNLLGFYHLTYTYTNTCTQTDTLVIEVKQAPIVSIDSVGTVCAGDAIHLKAISAYTTSWLWSATSGGLFSNSQTDSTTYTSSALDLQNGYVTLLVQASGDSLCSVVTASQTIKINDLPKPFIYLVNDSLFTTEKYRTYQWLKDGTPLSGDTFAFVKPTTTGMYAVIVSDNYYCTNTSQQYYFIYNGVAILPQDKEQAPFLYPNPGHGLYYINGTINPADIKVYHITGLPVNSVISSTQEGMYIAFSNPVSGVYIIELRKYGKVYQHKVICE
jgi:PKD repeat protein